MHHLIESSTVTADLEVASPNDGTPQLNDDDDDDQNFVFICVLYCIVLYCIVLYCISLSSPISRCCFRALLHFVQSSASHSQDIVAMSTAFLSLSLTLTQTS